MTKTLNLCNGAEPRLSDPGEIQLEQIASLIYRKFGIFIGKDKYERLSNRLERMVNRGFCKDTGDLYARLSSGDEQVYEELAGFVTTCHTFFFREPDHFALLASDIRTQGKPDPLIWCAACSTGEEPYSVAMSLLDSGITGFRIVASDVNRNVLELFNRGLYHENRFMRTDRSVRNRYFTSAGDGYWKIDGRLRSYVSIKNINLMERVQFPALFDYVFCRNVFMYFDERSRAAALGTITANLRSGGLLFTGQSEVLVSVPVQLHKAGCAVYRRA